MQHTTTFQLTTVIPPNLSLKITSDGIQGIPTSFAGIPIDFFVGVGSDCSTLSHFVSVGDLTKVELRTRCVVLTDSYTVTSDNFSLSSECFPYEGMFSRGTVSVAVSAMSSVNPIWKNPETCECSESEIVDWMRSVSPTTTIYVEGDFLIDGSVQSLSGESNTFMLLPYGDYYQIKRLNENITMADRMKRLVIDPNLKNNEDFWKLTNGMYGNEVTDLNYALPARIANYSNDHVFIDTMGYRNLKKVKALFDQSFPSFELDAIPPKIDRMIDIATIDPKRLFGHRCKCNMNFQPKGTCSGKMCGTCKQEKKINNLGNLLDQEMMISAGVPIVYQRKNTTTYQVIYPMPQDGLSAYPLKTLSAENINPTEVCFFEWNQTPQDNLLGNYLLMGDDLENRTRLMHSDESLWEQIVEENLLFDMHQIVQ